MQTISGGGAFTRQNIADINANFSQLFAGVTPGRIIYCSPGTTNLSQPADGSLSFPYQSLASAYGAGRNAKNDVIVLIGDGTTGATARVDSAFTWAKNALHLIGVASPVLMSQRARIAPTGATTAFTPFFTISASGCLFQNIQWFHGFNTGTTSQINMVLTGSRNYFKNCHIAGMGDDASAQSAGSRSLKIGSSGSGENLFEDCTIGVDTVTRTAANASLEFASATVRNVFRRCLFPFMTSSATVLGILGTGNECVDRFNEFNQCRFINATKSTSTGMTALLSFTTASPGGMILFTSCSMIGVTKFGDTNGLANSFLDMPVISAGAGGLMLAPT